MTIIYTPFIFSFNRQNVLSHFLLFATVITSDFLEHSTVKVTVYNLPTFFTILLTTGYHLPLDQFLWIYKKQF